MKRKIVVSLVAVNLFCMIGFYGDVLAQAPPPPPGEHELTTNQLPQGGTAPLGSGLALLIGLGCIYAAGSLLRARKEVV